MSPFVRTRRTFNLQRGIPNLPQGILLLERGITLLKQGRSDLERGMLAHVELAREEPWRYRHLYWECGLLGHALYLEAEAAGVRATGIGCYFDDEMHRLLGLRGDHWQSLYHFTVGGPREDTRLSTLPPYRFQP